ncbi:MAG: methionyl-tRNA formyltransferase [Azospirillum sp. 47_25]|jgi:methionyl-tRNA formyltransferase|uniref:Methionyl-tRNA formyltransferase n=1 Tax=Candidatus Scatocola faecipullorum TaxID=2840917 RepID=A0A9D1M5B0_9PROT|nr:MAG: methionyl-tRNA formyltransferase [Azospirillum sp. 47_25]HIU53832.1 methionyl-tRNA formyltransferase [Candidatus Scatocola faecipullorum]
MKIVFMGTPDFAVKALEALAARHEVVCVYTREPQEAGRGKKLTKSPVHEFAEAHGILVRTPKTLRSAEAQAELKALQADISVVAAYGLILPQAVIEAFPLGCINIHGSLLPRWRGAAPIQRAIEAGDNESGITIMKVVEKLDAGDMLLKGSVPITAETTGETLHDAMAGLGAELIVKALDNWQNLHAEPQDERLVTYAAKIDKAESRLDFSMPAEVLERKIRAFNPYPAVYFEYGGERYKILRAKVVDESGEAGAILDGAGRLVIACGDKALEVTEIQRQGKKKMPTEELLRGMNFCGRVE